MSADTDAVVLRDLCCSSLLEVKRAADAALVLVKKTRQDLDAHLQKFERRVLDENSRFEKIEHSLGNLNEVKDCLVELISEIKKDLSELNQIKENLPSLSEIEKSVKKINKLEEQTAPIVETIKNLQGFAKVVGWVKGPIKVTFTVLLVLLLLKVDIEHLGAVVKLLR